MRGLNIKRRELDINVSENGTDFPADECDPSQ
jgi:hypothetical protein